MMKCWMALLCALVLMLSAGLADVLTFGTPTPAPTPFPEESAEPQPEAAAVPPAQPNLRETLPAPGERYCDSQTFGIRNGPREAKRVAVTVDDCYERDKVQAVFDLAQQYGVRVTFFPLGDQLHEKDAALWRAIAASDCEIGSHTMHHTKMTNMSRGGCVTHLYRFQEVLDEVLGYHYGVVSVRPPFGAIRNEDGSLNRTVKSAFTSQGYEHAVLWDVSQTDAAKAKKQVKNGSILLYHARAKDVRCLEVLIPWLVEQGYELVTVRELLEFAPIETGPEKYVHQK